MVVAGLPVPSSDSAPPADNRLHEAIIDRLERGQMPAAIAKELGKGDKVKTARLRRKIWRLARHDEQFQRRLVERSRTTLLLGLPAATAGLVRQARRRPDAAKLLLEATGVHNTKVQHQHSGEIRVVMDIPRPKFVDAESVDEAEVVDLPAEPRP